MKTQLRKKALTLAVAACLGVSGAAMANDTSSSMRGQITGPNGNAAAGTKITIIHVPSGSTKTAVVNEAGLFSAKGLRVGGPYQVIVDSDTFEDTLVENVYLTLGNVYPINVELNAKANMEQIVVTGNVISSMSGGTGPAANFSLLDLQTAPAINRDLKDIVRADPRIFIDESRGEDAIQCGGGNSRFNSMTVDGVRMNDNFGLNDNGYPTVRAPFSFDAISQVSVELAPFDVKYGGFTSCNFNAVTKSGENESHGRVFFDYTNDSLQGDSIEDKDVTVGDYSEKRYGFSVGGPLIKDELFFFVSYEKLDGAEIFEYPPLQSDKITTADIDRIKQISQDVYQYDAGNFPASMPVDDEKILVKIDWNINDDHRANFVYNYNDGFRLSQSDAFAMTLDSHFFERGAELQSVVASLYSDWSDDFSTEMRIGKTELDARQESLDAASSFGEVSIRHKGQTIYLGPDDSRQSNDLAWDNITFKLAGTYYLDEHTFTAGYEYEKLNVFNLFMQHTQGEFQFNSIDDFEAGKASRVYYNNSSGTNNPDDVAANFSYALHTFYLQDEYSFTDVDLTLTYGLRYDRYTSDDKPNYNPNFEARHGYSNQKNMDGIDLLQPRVGFSWQAEDNLEVRGGFGLYSGGNPNVWVSNSYSNDGVTQIAVPYMKNVDLFNTPMTGDGRPGYEVPQSMYDAVQNTPIGGGDSPANAIDPNFEIPSAWKYALGATYTTADDYILTLDFLHTANKDSAIIRDVAMKKSDKTGPDGRPLYEKIDNRNGEYVLGNVSGDDAKSTVLSTALSKKFDNGFDFTVSYAFTKSEDVNPMTSSVAGSNYGNIAVTDPGNPGLATSNFEVPHRFTFKLGYSAEIFSGYKTRFNLLGQASEGRPYDYTFESSDRAFGDENFNGSRQLLYIPLETDPNVVYGADFDKAAFDKFIADNGLTRGKAVGRNSFNADWWVKFDLKISQELPGFMEGHRGQAYFTIKNIGNLLNDDWGVLKEGAFVGNRMVKASVNSDGQFVYNQFNSGNEDLDTKNNASLWQLRLGVSYTF